LLSKHQQSDTEYQQDKTRHYPVNKESKKIVDKKILNIFDHLNKILPLVVQQQEVEIEDKMFVRKQK